MKDDWTYNLKERMADYGETPPEGLWDDIDKALATAGKAGATRRFPIVRFARIAAVAAVVAVVAVTGYYYDKHTHVLPAFSIPILSATDGEKDRDDVFMVTATDNAGSTVTSAITHRLAAALPPAIPGYGPEPAEGSGSVAQQPAGEAPSAPAAAPATEYPVSTGTPDEPAPDERPIARRRPDPAVAERNYHKRPVSAAGSTRLVIGLSSSSTMAGTDISTESAQDLVADMPGGINDGINGMLSGSFATLKHYDCFKNQVRMKDDFKHHRPIRTGITLSYTLTDRLSVSSGLLYALHSSDLEYGDGTFYSSGKRTLHYLGIPLSLNYRLYTWRNFDVYASAGTVAEKCVAGRLERRFFNNGELTESESIDVMEHRWQWSVNAAAGVQLRLAEHVGLYAEPGVGYYIDNGSDIDTYYKEKPLNLNLNIGLRVTVP